MKTDASIMPANGVPEPLYRWVILSASAAMLAIAMGVMVNGLSVFVIPLSTEFGWQRGSVSLINVGGLVGLAGGEVVMGQIATAIMIGSAGWRDTLATMGAIALATLIPLALLIRQSPVDRRIEEGGVAALDDATPVPLPSNVLTAWLGHGIGGYQGGFFFDQTGSHAVSYANAALAGIVNLVIVGALHATLSRRKAVTAFAE